MHQRIDTGHVAPTGILAIWRMAWPLVLGEFWGVLYRFACRPPPWWTALKRKDSADPLLFNSVGPALALAWILEQLKSSLSEAAIRHLFFSHSNPHHLHTRLLDQPRPFPTYSHFRATMLDMLPIAAGTGGSDSLFACGSGGSGAAVQYAPGCSPDSLPTILPTPSSLASELLQAYNHFGYLGPHSADSDASASPKDGIPALLYCSTTHDRPDKSESQGEQEQYSGYDSKAGQGDSSGPEDAWRYFIPATLAASAALTASNRPATRIETAQSSGPLGALTRSLKSHGLAVAIWGLQRAKTAVDAEGVKEDQGGSAPSQGWASWGGNVVWDAGVSIVDTVQYVAETISCAVRDVYSYASTTALGMWSEKDVDAGEETANGNTNSEGEIPNMNTQPGDDIAGKLLQMPTDAHDNILETPRVLSEGPDTGYGSSTPGRFPQ
jgi:hypothetical protein